MERYRIAVVEVESWGGDIMTARPIPDDKGEWVKAEAALKEIDLLREELIGANKVAMLWIANHGEAQERAERAEEEIARLQKQVLEWQQRLAHAQDAVWRVQEERDRLWAVVNALQKQAKTFGSVSLSADVRKALNWLKEDT